MIWAGGGAIFTAPPSSSTPSQFLQAYLGRIWRITRTFAGTISSFSETSSPIRLSLQPQAQTFSSSARSWTISIRGNSSGSSLRPFFRRVCSGITISLASSSFSAGGFSGMSKRHNCDDGTAGCFSDFGAKRACRRRRFSSSSRDNISPREAIIPFSSTVLSGSVCRSCFMATW